MNTKLSQKNNSQDFKSALKLLAIIAFWEAIIMTVLPFVGTLSPLLEGIIDTTLLTLLSGLSIWFFIILPEKKNVQKEQSDKIHFLGQEIKAIDQIGIVTATDLDGKIIYANDNFCKISGYSREELIMQDHRLINSGHHSKEFFKLMWSNLKSGKPWRGQVCNKKKSGELYWVESYIFPVFDTEGKPSRYLSLRFDVTAEKLIEESLEQERIKNIHMARLSAIGEMAGGIAHEINNPLSIISGLISVTERKLQRSITAEEVHKILDNLAKAQAQITRMSKIINGLREFSRSGDDQPFEYVSIQKLFDIVKDLCSEKLHRSRIKLEVPVDDIKFQCNPIQIEQVLVNLIGNSIDAISTQNEKWIRIKTSLRDEFIQISVTDSGPGISPAIAQKIMQPFFTTKEIGKGTGLGLSISRSIIEKHGGTLSPDLNSANTSFVINLPLHESALIGLLNIDEAISSHLAWKHKFLNLLSDPTCIKGCENVGSDNHCSLGNWIEKSEYRFKNNSHFLELKNAHTEFHVCTAEMVQRAEKGDLIISELTSGSGSDYDRLSTNLISAIHSFRNSSASTDEQLKMHQKVNL